jgi:TatA/E family protein of Tat protein translocase
MFGSLGIPEMILIFIVALIVFGPKRLPEIGRTLGKALGEFKKATDDFKNTIEREVRVEEIKQLSSTQAPVIDTVSRTEPAAEPAEAPHPKHDPAEPMTADQMAALSAAPSAESHD